ncbi:MAG: ISNCY family transposase [Desulfarculaceae bacterium]|jgi:IS5 family transposase
MRQKRQIQLKLSGPWPDHPFSRELSVMAAILDDNPVIAEKAWQDIVEDRSHQTGAPGLAAMAVVKAAVLQKVLGASYERLAFHLADSASCRRFLGLGPFDIAPSASALQDNVSRLKPRTWESINRVLMKWAQEAGIEKGRKMRFDSTAVEADIHHPTDSSLLSDLVRVICRLVKKAGLPKSLRCRDRRRVARRLALKILNAKNAKQRKSLYRRLLRHCQDLYMEALDMLNRLDGDWRELKADLAHWLDLLQKVIEQTRQRVLLDRMLPPEQKIVSVFETHADILVKDRRDTVFGHKICLAGGASCLITDCTIEDGNPPDSLLAPKMIVRHEGIYGKPPRQAALDGGFASKANLKAIKAYGVKDVCFHKKRGIQIGDMVKSSWVFRQLKNFRAGIEGCISALKRVFGLDRCSWRGRQGFHAYVWTSIVTYNLAVMARHCIA